MYCPIHYTELIQGAKKCIILGCHELRYGDHTTCSTHFSADLDFGKDEKDTDDSTNSSEWGGTCTDQSAIDRDWQSSSDEATVGINSDESTGADYYKWHEEMKAVEKQEEEDMRTIQKNLGLSPKVCKFQGMFGMCTRTRFDDSTFCKDHMAMITKQDNEQIAKNLKVKRETQAKFGRRRLYNSIVGRKHLPPKVQQPDFKCRTCGGPRPAKQFECLDCAAKRPAC